MAKIKETFRLDLHGQRFGHWIVLQKHCEKDRFGNIYWLCKCDCGSKKVVIARSLRRGVSKSCGCYNREVHTRHGKGSAPIYNIWTQMLARCNNPKATSYHNYGARGIKVCKRWHSFENFYADMGDNPEDKTLNRINMDGDYSPSNCNWASWKEQNRNTRRTTFVRWNGKLMSTAELAEISGLRRKLVLERIRRGLSVKAATSKQRHGRWGPTLSTVK